MHTYKRRTKNKVEEDKEKKESVPFKKKGLEIIKKKITKSSIGKELGKLAVKIAPKVYKKVLVK